MLHQEIFVEPRAANCDKLGTERISPLAFQQSGVLDFNTRITSSLNIEFGQALLESAGGTLENFVILKKLYKTFNLMSILRTSRGNGTFANFRITGLLGEKYKNQARRLPNNRPGGGWLEQAVNQLLEELARSKNTSFDSTWEIQNAASATTSAVTAINTTVHFNSRTNIGFDVVIHEMPFGWLQSPQEVDATCDSLLDAVHSAHRYFGAKVVIFMTAPISDNVDNIKSMRLVNHAIYNFSRSYVPLKDGRGVQSVQVLDLGRFSLELVTHNAAMLGMLKESAEDIIQESRNRRGHDYNEHCRQSILMDHLGPALVHRLDCCSKETEMIVANSCGEIPVNFTQAKSCKKSSFSYDGMHWCLKETAGRIDAAIACIIQCSYRDMENNANECEERCNAMYMTVDPIVWNEGVDVLENH